MSNININPLENKNLDGETLAKYVIEKESTLSQDYNERVFGIRNSIGNGYKFAGYENLRKFFDGDHWSYIKEDGTPIRVYNYCRKTVENFTSFLANEPPTNSVPPIDRTDSVSVFAAEEAEKILEGVYYDNNFPILFAGAVQNQSLLGDSFIFGPYIEWIVSGEKRIPRIRFKNIKKPENVRILWADDDYTEMNGFIFYYWVSHETIEKLYSKQIKDKGITFSRSGAFSRDRNATNQDMILLRIYWDDTYMLVLSESQVLDFVQHNWGFIPGHYIKNASASVRPWGISDIEDMLDAQVEYNEVTSETRGKIKQAAIPHIFYSGEGAPISYSAGEAQMVKLGPTDRVFPDPMAQSTAPFEMYTQGRKQDMHMLSQISEIFYGGAMTLKATGRALSILMQGVNNKVKLKQQFWTTALRNLNSGILRLTELYFPSSKEIIGGNYKTNIFFPAVLIRNVIQEINKFNAKTQSLSTTMKNSGISSPSEEIKIMKREWNDESLAIEISRSPQLRLQLQNALSQQITATKAQNPQLSESAGGAGVMRGESSPMAQRGSIGQSPLSPESAVRLSSIRNG